MQKICGISGQFFTITSEDLAFYDSMSVPPPSLAPAERQRRRTSFRNFYRLFHRPCSATGKKLISMYPPDATFPVFDNAHWWSDSWDAKSYGREFDFSRPFFDQYQELNNIVPRYSIMNINCENCEYSNFAGTSRNCYLVFGCVRNQDCLYGHMVWDCKSCVDCLYAFRCEWCSHSVDIFQCYDVHYSQDSSNCQESYFLYDCVSCQNCFCCFNLRNKQYCIFNKQCTKEQYRQALGQLFPLSRDKVQVFADRLDTAKREQAISPEYFGVRNEDATGNHLYETKNLNDCFDQKKSEDSKYCFSNFELKRCYDVSFNGAFLHWSIDTLSAFDSQNIRYSHLISASSEIDYSEFCYNSHDLFGCNGLRNSSYAILNKEYAKDEYQQLRTRIVDHMKRTGEWGEFFPSTLSPFAYNDSIAQDYQPLTKQEVLARGLQWREESVYSKPVHLSSPPQLISEASSEVTKGAFECRNTYKPYRIVRAEYEFYSRMGLPLPDCCPDERMRSRFARRARREVISRNCSKCSKAILTAHSIEYAQMVYCEACYIAALH